MKKIKNKYMYLFLCALLFLLCNLSSIYAQNKTEEICYVKLSQIPNSKYQSEDAKQTDGYGIEFDKNQYIYHHSFWALDEDIKWKENFYAQKLKLKSEKNKCKKLFKYFKEIKNSPDHASYNKKCDYIYVADVYYSTYDKKGKYNREISRSERYYFSEKEYNSLVKQFNNTRKNQTIENLFYYKYGEDTYYEDSYSLYLLYKNGDEMYRLDFGFGCDTSFQFWDKKRNVRTGCYFGDKKTKELRQYINKIEIPMKAYSPYHENKDGVMVTEYKNRMIKICFGDISGDCYCLSKKEYNKLLKKCKELQKIAKKYSR